jgi:hypothetical protein
MRRPLENVVLWDRRVPVVERGGTRPVAFVPRRDGSGVLSADLSAMYRAEPDKDLETRGVTGGRDIGVRHTRSFAVDYGRESGGAAVFAVVDRLVGPGRKTWRLFPGRGTRAAVAGRTVTIHGAKASLRITFVAPAAVSIARPQRVLPYQDGEKTATLRFSPIEATCRAEAAGFFAVMTLQKNGQPAPPVKVSGAGLDAVVTVGRRTLRFDGEKFLLGPERSGG